MLTPKDSARAVTLIRPPFWWQPTNLSELWRFRDLLWLLVLRDLKARYKQTTLGAVWVVLPTLLTMFVFDLLFGLLGRDKPTADGIPYVVSTYCALVPWQMFANSTRQGAESLVAHQLLIKKVYFPRLLIPLSPILANVVDIAIAFVVLGGLMAYHGVSTGWTAIAVLPLVALTMLFAFTASLWLSALSALYRDFRYVTPLLIQLGMYVSPTIYTTASLDLEGGLPGWAVTLYWLNPLVSILEGFRWALLGQAAPDTARVLTSLAGMVLILLAGLLFFRRVEVNLADRV